jgi:segregation and condensation protein A
MHLRLENFDGPLDLLLHLIKAQELNIFNIPIVTITEQFLSFLKQIPQLDFYAAGEYLAMAAQLIEIKANMLVPVLQKKYDQVQSLEDLDDEDPRKVLVEQLLEFEAIRKASEILGAQSNLNQDVYPSKEYKRREDEFSLFEHPIKGNAFELVIAFERVLLEFSVQKSAPKVMVRAQKITIQQKMISVKKRLEMMDLLTLKELIADCMSRYELIVVLMAVLELCKANHLIIQQDQAFAEVQLRRGEKFSDNLVADEVDS